jgi:hypothetical protein
MLCEASRYVELHVFIVVSPAIPIALSMVCCT